MWGFEPNRRYIRGVLVTIEIIRRSDTKRRGRRICAETERKGEG